MFELRLVLGRFTILQFTMPMKNTIIIHTTVTCLEDARKIATILLEQNLIGCAQIDGPIESIYRWENSIETSKEYRLSVKSTTALAPEIIATIEEHHPYDVPEIIGNSLDYCSSGYRNWLVGEVKNVST